MGSFGIRKGLEDIAGELKAMKHILASIWHSRYQNDETDKMNPEAYADEYISTEECARRLGISDQTIRNWIAAGKTHPEKGWKEGLHYVNVSPYKAPKAVIRIPWNTLIQTFGKNRDIVLADFYGNKYQNKDPEKR